MWVYAQFVYIMCTCMWLHVSMRVCLWVCALACPSIHMEDRGCSLLSLDILSLPSCLGWGLIHCYRLLSFRVSRCCPISVIYLVLGMLELHGCMLLTWLCVGRFCKCQCVWCRKYFVLWFTSPVLVIFFLISSLETLWFLIEY